MRSHLRIAPAAILALAVGGCGLIDDAKSAVESAVSNIQNSIQQAREAVSEKNMNKLVSLASSSGEQIGNRVRQTSLRSGSSGDDRIGGAPAYHFEPSQATDSTLAECVEVSESSTIVIEDYSACSDQAGQIKYEITPPDEGELKMNITFTGYASGASDSTDYLGIDGRTVWSMTGSPGGFLILSKEQVTLTYNVETTEPASAREVTRGAGPAGDVATALETKTVQSNNLWTYFLNFERGDLTINTTAAFTDLDTLTTSVLDFQEVTFQDPNVSDDACPTGLVAGTASLKAGDASLTVEVDSCGTGTYTRETTEQSETKEIGNRASEPGEPSLEGIFGGAIDGFISLIDDIENAEIRDNIEAESRALGADCISDRSKVNLTSEDPGYYMLGTWCTAWPAAYGDNGQPQEGPGWLECVRFCRQNGATKYERFGGVAKGWKKPAPAYRDAPYYVDADFNWDDQSSDYGALVRDAFPFDYPPGDFQAVCRDFVWEQGTVVAHWASQPSINDWRSAAWNAEFEPTEASNPFDGSGYTHGRPPMATIEADVFVEVGGDDEATDDGSEAEGRLELLEVVQGENRSDLDWWLPYFHGLSLEPSYYPEFLMQSFRSDRVPPPDKRCTEADYAEVDAAAGGDEEL